MRWIDKLNFPKKQIKKIVERKCPGQALEGYPNAPRIGNGCNGGKCVECWNMEEGE